ncbi:MAG: HIT domain-containing protein, partial [Actinomycetota bacterium]
MEHLWAGWRNSYVRGGDAEGEDQRPAIEVADDQTLFEAILHSGYPDRDTLILWRGERVFAMLNAYPYTSGHLMVLPKRAVVQLTELDDDEYAELWHGVRLATRAVEAAYAPQGIN